ncbi:hypothetical protein IPG41_04220 [Candidatus Peregrinibacteria bacterium]|nr:MAG: hypothetical protein IPG41_04220 [Candidatus Peregrinibacteria bacterium]
MSDAEHNVTEELDANGSGEQLLDKQWRKVLLERVAQIQIGLKLKKPRKFETEEEVHQCLASFGANTRTVLSVILGIEGEQTWVTRQEPWHQPDQMRRSVEQGSLDVFARKKSYRGQELNGHLSSWNVSLRSQRLENDVISQFQPNDPCLPITLQVNFTPSKHKIRAKAQTRLEPMGRRVQEFFRGCSPVSLNYQDDSLTIEAPFKDIFQCGEDGENYRRTSPVDFLCITMEEAALAGKGAKGADLFNRVATCLTPQLGAGFKSAARSSVPAPLFRHSAYFLTSPSSTEAPQVASFFGITTEQIHAALTSAFSVG